MKGMANAYNAPNNTPATPPTTLASVVTPNIPYKTRITVRRPVDPAKFNGTVLVEWFNVTDNFDGEYFWVQAQQDIVRQGYAYIGVSAQDNGISNANLGLKTFSPTRYGILNVNASNASCCTAGQAVLRHLLPDCQGGVHIPAADEGSHGQERDRHRHVAIRIPSRGVHQLHPHARADLRRVPDPGGHAGDPRRPDGAVDQGAERDRGLVGQLERGPARHRAAQDLLDRGLQPWRPDAAHGPQRRAHTRSRAAEYAQRFVRARRVDAHSLARPFPSCPERRRLLSEAAGRAGRSAAIWPALHARERCAERGRAARQRGQRGWRDPHSRTWTCRRPARTEPNAR